MSSDIAVNEASSRNFWLVLSSFSEDSSVNITGEIIHSSREAPSLLYNKKEDIVLTDWPVELWHAVPVSEDCIILKGNNALLTDQIRLIKKIPSEQLFGSSGVDIVSILDRIGFLKPDDIDLLSGCMDQLLKDSYCRAWRLWINEGRASKALTDDTLCSLLILHSAKGRSPVNYGLHLIANVFRHWVTKEYPEEYSLSKGSKRMDAKWHKAQKILICAAMGYGMKDILSVEEFSVLIKGWRLLNH